MKGREGREHRVRDPARVGGRGALGAPTLAVIICAAGLLAGAARPLRAQSRKGRLDHLGGPASLVGRPLSAIAGVRTLDDQDLRRWQPTYRGEDVKRGPSQRWLESDWSVRLNAVGDTVYRVTLEAFLTDLAAADSLYKKLSAVFLGELGEPNQEDCNDFRWIGEDGDAFLRTTDVAEGRQVTVVFTSNATRTFTRP